MSSISPDVAAAAHLAAGRPLEALQVLEPVARAPDAPHGLLARYATILKALDRTDECLAVRRLAARRFPESGVAWHNLASILGDLGRGDEALDACRKAFSAGLDAPETWLIYARALAAEGRPDDALSAFDEAIKRRPGYLEALTEKARLIWSRSGDLDKAAAVFPRHPAYALSLADLCKAAGDPARAFAVVDVAARQTPGDVNLLHAVVALGLETDQIARACEAAAQASRLAPEHPASVQGWAAACLATGRAEEALAIARRLVEAQPFDQSALALGAVAARLAGAPDYERLYDYAAFVRTFDIDPPAGWATTEAFLAGLKTSLDAMHAGSARPLEQSLRHGTQTPGDLKSSDDPVIKAFFVAVDPLIRRYIADLGPGADPLRARATADYALVGAWSIRLSSEGFHVDHMHPRGWLSSAFYVEAPPETRDRQSKAGWLQFGRPSLRTAPPLQPAHFVQPIPGRLVLFPSYMWHGTLPFTSTEPRMTIAFDVAPV